ncbi:hypothetical protein FRB98_002306 [Tulasnella sp. 332]|nr:hypothetical protein FRB98_002306 [Tulasnella sp. 332]
MFQICIKWGIKPTDYLQVDASRYLIDREGPFSLATRTRSTKPSGPILYPTALFVFPLSRAMSAPQVTWAGIVSNDTKPPPLTLEDLRDEYGLRTADKRVNKASIHLVYPSFGVEEGFTKEDELWMPGERETDEHGVNRTARALYGVLRAQDTYLRIIDHSMTMNDTLKLTGHREYDVPTGGGKGSSPPEPIQHILNELND